MSSKSISVLIVALSLFGMAACGPESQSGAADVSSENGNVDAVAREAPTPTLEPTPIPTPIAAADSGAEITSSVTVSGLRPLEWAADDENCIVPGLVITGANANLAPCEPLPDAETSETVSPETPEKGTTMPEETAVPEASTGDETQTQEQDDYAARMTAQAVDDLSQRLGIPTDEIEVREVRSVTWPDSSMGCPQPDMMYAQMLQEGVLIRLFANGEMYFYHGGGDQPPFLCEEGGLQMPDDRDGLEFVPPPDSEIDAGD